MVTYSYFLPADRREIAARFWSVSQAARAWSCSYRTARRHMLLHPEICVMLEIWRAGYIQPRYKLAVPIGRKRADTHRGNPDWHDSRKQSELVRRRWQKKFLEEVHVADRYGATPPPAPRKRRYFSDD